jgi:hypothetical protein
VAKRLLDQGMVAKLVRGGLGHAVRSIGKVEPPIGETEEPRFVEGGRRFIGQVYGHHRVTPVLIHFTHGGRIPPIFIKVARGTAMRSSAIGSGIVLEFYGMPRVAQQRLA